MCEIDVGGFAQQHFPQQDHGKEDEKDTKTAQKRPTQKMLTRSRPADTTTCSRDTIRQPFEQRLPTRTHNTRRALRVTKEISLESTETIWRYRRWWWQLQPAHRRKRCSRCGRARLRGCPDRCEPRYKNATHAVSARR